MLKSTPFLLFDGNCAEVMHFYQACLGGTLEMTKVGDTPMKAQFPVEKHERITYAHLVNGAVDISATDWLHPTRKPKEGNTVAIYLTADTADELKDAFDKLAKGAPKDLLDALQTTPFGSYGHLVDKYGVNWFFRSQA